MNTSEWIAQFGYSSVVEHSTAPNATLYQLADTQDITHAAITSKWKWGGHVARLPGDRWAYRATMWDPWIGRRLQGRPRRRWADFFKEQAECTERRLGWRAAFDRPKLQWTDQVIMGLIFLGGREHREEDKVEWRKTVNKAINLLLFDDFQAVIVRSKIVETSQANRSIEDVPYVALTIPNTNYKFRVDRPGDLKLGPLPYYDVWIDYEIVIQGIQGMMYAESDREEKDNANCVCQPAGAETIH
ncbi:hypothetical protein ANN_02670 [Periplaneta americana]|uniref:Uncharacterized protein n=1 Tax=Periplaneta americana TaxID=6978 RepID=A0ABQ8TWZ8_PERAM|nr:hypothetical protein ANN_02670 [Periplaneta americana]